MRIQEILVRVREFASGNHKIERDEQMHLYYYRAALFQCSLSFSYFKDYAETTPLKSSHFTLNQTSNFQILNFTFPFLSKHWDSWRSVYYHPSFFFPDSFSRLQVPSFLPRACYIVIATGCNRMSQHNSTF